MTDHPVYLTGRLTEALAELGRRLTARCDADLIASQLDKCIELSRWLEDSLRKYDEAILYEDLKRSIEARIAMQDGKQAAEA